jgi:hypothetical protein
MQPVCGNTKLKAARQRSNQHDQEATMNTPKTHAKQRGFLAFGAAIALLAVYGGVGVAAKSLDPGDNKTAETHQTQSAVVASK